ncbi:MAG: HD domain-containing protein [Spirochaetes bacterium]|nr:HD domain-containing protein [Spirochaetota bacterium]MBU0955714.1 HD domain-containing protein [Spirochaetota bacterium]
MASGTVGIIEIGSTGIRLLIANVSADGSFELLETAGRQSMLGRDAFTSRQISREAMNQTISILRGFREILKAYGLEPAQVHLVATSALREAENRDTFVDRVAMRTGFRIEIIEDIEESHYLYLAVQHALGEDAAYFAKSNTLMMEVGGGTTELMLLRRGRIVSAHSLNLGTVRVEEQVKAAAATTSYLSRILADSIRTVCGNLEEELPLSRVRNFIVLGTDARFAARIIGQHGRSQYRVVTKAAFVEFVDHLQALSIDEITATYHLPYSEAEAVIPGLIIISLFLERTAAEELIVPSVSIREGILLTLAGGKDQQVAAELHRQVVASAVNLGRRYRFDEKHASWVSQAALFLFDRLQDTHGLSPRDRLLLEVSAQLHDIGSFIRSSSHHKHSEYIVKNSEIFGLQRQELVVIANIVRYHRKGGPSAAHINYASLVHEDRVLVLKLASLLRVADALDKSHTQRLQLVDLQIRDENLVLITDAEYDLSLERLSLRAKSDLFEDVFGQKVIIL